MKNLLAFDVVLSSHSTQDTDEGKETVGPLGISVAGTFVYCGEERLWYSMNDHYAPLQHVTPEKAQELLAYLRQMQNDDFMLFSWNGLGSNLRWLGQVADQMHLAAEIALQSYDPMFQLFNAKGHLVTLTEVAQAMGLPQAAALNPADVSRMWHTGWHGAILEHLIRRCRNMNEVVWLIEAAGEMRWIAADGAVQRNPIQRMKTVEEILSEPEPESSSMRTPFPREKFCGWLNGARERRATWNRQESTVSRGA